jgi:hypothetical protein
MIYVDTCITWIEAKGASYLAKEDLIVYYSSPTGRKSDYKWFKLKTTEVLRTIRAYNLSPTEQDKLKRSHLITAFQELGRVYEYGDNCAYDTLPTVYNYIKEAGMTLPDAVAHGIASSLSSHGMLTVVQEDVLFIFTNILRKLKECKMRSRDMAGCLEEPMKTFEYVPRVGNSRIRIKGGTDKKVSAYMKFGTTPKDVHYLSSEVKWWCINKVYGELL